MKKVLDEKTFEQEMKKLDFRVAVFGSARIKNDDKDYKIVEHLARRIGEEEIDIVTGGGPGLMEAANKGHREGSKNNNADSLGLLIKLPHEQTSNGYINVRKEFDVFINRLESFLKLSHAVVIAPGGIGTLLEFSYTLQVLQVKKSREIPIILMGNMWMDLVRWMQVWQIKKGYVNREDLDSIYVVKRPEEAMEIINATKKRYENKEKNLCPDIQKYKIKFDRSTNRFFR